MGLFKEMVSNIKKIVVSDDDDNLFDNEEMFKEEEENKKMPKLPFSKKNESAKPVGVNFDLNTFNINGQRTDNKKMANKGKIQVYVPKTFEQSFDIIREVKQGITVMVNVEMSSPQTAQRIVDLLTGALVALEGQCKKIGEKQYIFSLNAEMTGAFDYIPQSSNMGMGNQYSSSSFSTQNPFSFQDFQYGYNQGIKNMNNMQNIPNQQNNQYQEQNYGNQNYNDMFNQGFQNNDMNQAPNQSSAFNPSEYYNPPINQF